MDGTTIGNTGSGAAHESLTYEGLFNFIKNDLNYVPTDTWNNGGVINLPDFKGTSPVGVDAGDISFDIPGKSGGEKNHVLSLGELPSHTHQIDPPQTQTSQNDTDHYHGGSSITGFASGAGTGFVGTVSGSWRHAWAGNTGWNSHNHRHTVNIDSFASDSAGGNNPHNNMHPYITVNFFIKI
jgi:microcystin-dependent protein